MNYHKDVLLKGTNGHAVGRYDGYEWEPSGVNYPYDMYECSLDIGTLTHFALITD